MATWDSADLLARCKRHAHRPAVDASVSDSDWYAFLTEAQAYWMSVFGAQLPHAGGNIIIEKLNSSDNGATYDLTSYPLGQVEIRTSRSGRVLTPGADWNPAADFIIEGQKIRIPNGKTRTWADGPYARYVGTPGEINASTQPILKPEPARILLVWRALYLWASRPPYLADPDRYAEMETQEWAGTPDGRKIGWREILQNQYFGQGMDSIPQDEGSPWWHSPDLS